MSSPSDPSQPGKAKQDGLGKLFRRMSSALRRNSSRSVSVVSTQPEPVQQPEPPKTTVPRSTTAVSASVSAKEPVSKPMPPPIEMSHWSVVQEEKARALFAKYGLTLEPGEWKSPSDMTVQRVTKPIRMRVRRTCHRCQTTFGPDKLCVNCQHVRCKKCPRYPPAKPKDYEHAHGHDHVHLSTETALQNILARKAAATGAAPPYRTPGRKRKEPELTIPSRTGGQDLIRKPVVQRVRRTCHRCNMTFGAGTTECYGCRHIRCKKCPRDPPKLHKYPDGYPGDAEPTADPPARTWRKPRQRVRYTCHECSTVYRSGERFCSHCGQEKGPQTLRDPPKRQKPEPDPEIILRVEERLAKVKLETSLIG